MTQKSYSEILQDPSIDTDTRRTLEAVDPIVRNRFESVIRILEEKQRVEGMRKFQPWIAGFLQYLNDRFVEVQKQMTNPELRPERVSPEFLSGEMKGILTAIGKIREDLAILEKVDLAEGLPDLEKK